MAVLSVRPAAKARNTMTGAAQDGSKPETSIVATVRTNSTSTPGPTRIQSSVSGRSEGDDHRGSKVAVSRCRC